MLRMPAFEVHLPQTAAEAVGLRKDLEASMYVAGGTDLLVNLKHQLFTPKHLISLAQVEELRGIKMGADGTLTLGAGTCLQDLADSKLLRKEIPALAEAASLIAGPQHRRMGTLGGNIMLDTRCLFYNQTEHWRKSLGYCLKKSGDWCHVIGSKATCVAAQSSDSVPVLLALDAHLEFADKDGESNVSMAELFRQDGRQPHTIGDEALVRRIVVPPRQSEHRSTYRKVRARGAVDFPQLGLALNAAFDGPILTSLTGVVGAVMPKPKVLRKLDLAHGTQLEDQVIEELAEAAFKQVRPQSSIHGDPAWRRHMVRVEMRRGLTALRG